MPSATKYYIIAGEASGDLHASNLIKELKKLDPDATFRGRGGDLMTAEGFVNVKHYKDMAFMGFLEVVQNLKTIFSELSRCKEDILNHKPDVIIFIDYPGFNMRIAEWAKKQGIRTVYYISPQIWAWKQSRVHKLKRDIDLMLTILPFEKEFYARFDCDVTFVGHPLLDALPPHKAFETNSKKQVALLPGSRKQEISTMLPIMLQVADRMPDVEFTIAGAPSQQRSFYQEYIGTRNTALFFDQTYDLLSRCDAALVTSGTATLETALLDVPEAVCYKGNSISYSIARMLIKVKFISLVNLILDREAVKELIQYKMTAESMEAELKELIYNQERITNIKSDYLELKTMLGGKGASARAAEAVLDFLKK